MHRIPDHVDGHQHVHQLPVVRDALMDELVARYPLPGPWLRSTRRAAVAPFKAWVIDALGGSALRRGAAERGLVTQPTPAGGVRL